MIRFDDWTGKASCRGVSAEYFFPEAGSRRVSASVEVDGITFRSLFPKERYTKAQFCAGCPVRTECLALALWYEQQPNWEGKGRLGVQQGIWGGTTRDERHRTRHLSNSGRMVVLDELLRAQLGGAWMEEEAS